MELQVKPIEIPERISFNYEELKQALAETLQKYEGIVYTPDHLKQAKADRAALNKLKKALNDERIRREREYMRPFTEFKAQIADLIAAIDAPVALIDSQVKEYEEQKKREKRQEIEEMFESGFKHMFPKWMEFDQIFNPKWLNASVSMSAIGADLDAMATRILSDLTALSEMPSFAFEATEVYKQTLNLQTAVNEGKRLAEIQRRKEEAEQLKAEEEQQAQAVEHGSHIEEVPAIGEGVQIGGDLPPAAEAGQWISFKAFLTVAQAVELRKFFEQSGIEFKAI